MKGCGVTEVEYMISIVVVGSQGGGCAYCHLA